MEIWWTIIIISAFISVYGSLWYLIQLLFNAKHVGIILMKISIFSGIAVVTWSILLTKLEQLIR